MKKLAFLSFVALVAWAGFSACSTVSSMVPGGVSMPGGTLIKPGAIAGAVDFKDGEVLCANGNDPYGETFNLAKIVTAPSAATKNQAEVVYVADGKKEWVNLIIPSRKSVKTDLTIGKVLFAPIWHQQQKEVSSDEYRKGRWELGRVSSTDELFKDIVEVNGNKYYWQQLRTPDKEP